MKNTIIALLSFVCIFLIANTMGVFDFMSLSNHDERIVFQKQREKAVNRAKTYKLVFLYHENEPDEMEVLQGIEDTIEQLNQTATKKYELIKDNTIQTLPEFNQAVQKYNDDPSIAMILGPLHSAFIPSSRALASMYSMPLLSADTFRNEHLPQLDFDTYQPMFPVLEKWVELMGKDINQRIKSEKLLIISPEKGTFGDIFATSMERFSDANMDLKGTYRLNYTEPLKDTELVDSMKFLTTEKDISAILYTGGFNDFGIFIELAQRYFPNAIIYGVDSIFVDEVLNGTYSNKLYLPKLNVSVDPQFAQRLNSKYGKEPNYITVTAQKMMLSIDSVLKKLGKYDVVQFMKLFRQEVEQFHKESSLSLFLVNPD